jgi:hypothetical protein
VEGSAAELAEVLGGEPRVGGYGDRLAALEALIDEPVEIGVLVLLADLLPTAPAGCRSAVA